MRADEGAPMAKAHEQYPSCSNSESRPRRITHDNGDIAGPSAPSVGHQCLDSHAALHNDEKAPRNREKSKQKAEEEAEQASESGAAPDSADQTIPEAHAAWKDGMPTQLEGQGEQAGLQLGAAISQTSPGANAICPKDDE